MNVLSLFDGMSCGRIALERSGIKVDKYFASEIDKYTIQISKKNYPDIIQLGDVTGISYKDGQLKSGDMRYLTNIDILIAGSPCQGFSFAGKQLNFNDPRSALFFEFVRLLKETRPKFFLLENVVMKKEYQDVISKELGVEPILINSSLLSAQSRKRLYWTNIPSITQPEDRGLLLKDIVETGLVDRDKSYCIDANYAKGGNPDQYFNKSRRQLVFLDKHSSKNGLNCVAGLDGTKKWDETKNLQRNFSQGERVYSTDGKSPTLSANGGGTAGKSVLVIDYKNHTGNMAKQKIKSNIRFLDKKSKTLTTSSGSPATSGGAIIEDNVSDETLTWRKLTPTECEALQTLPRGYTDTVSSSQRYKMIGNGWTVDVIAWIFSFMKQKESI